jgi:hypothetical protein
MIARRWRLGAMLLALLSFVMAAMDSGPLGAVRASAWMLGGWLSRVGGMAFFWVGVALLLVSVWGRGST